MLSVVLLWGGFELEGGGHYQMFVAECFAELGGSHQGQCLSPSGHLQGLQTLCCCDWRKAGEEEGSGTWWAESPGVQLNLSQCTEQPPRQRITDSNVNSAEAENSCILVHVTSRQEEPSLISHSGFNYFRLLHIIHINRKEKRKGREEEREEGGEGERQNYPFQEPRIS